MVELKYYDKNTDSMDSNILDIVESTATDWQI